MRDFDKQLEQYGDELKRVRCPYSDAELDREIRSVVWNTPGNADFLVRTDNAPRAPRRWLWPSVAAAACLAAIIIPMRTRTSALPERVDVDGEHLYFACNNGCSPESTLETFKTMIK